MKIFKIEIDGKKIELIDSKGPFLTEEEAKKFMEGPGYAAMKRVEEELSKEEVLTKLDKTTTITHEETNQSAPPVEN